MFIISSAPRTCWASANVRAFESVGELLVVLGDHARSAAVCAVELDQLDVQQRRDLRHRAVQLGSEASAHAAGPVGDLHCCSLRCSGRRRGVIARLACLGGCLRGAYARLLLFVLAADIQVQLVALGTALHGLVDPLHGLQVLAWGSCGRRRDLRVHLTFHDSSDRQPAASSSSSLPAAGWNLPNHELPPYERGNISASCSRP